MMSDIFCLLYNLYIMSIYDTVYVCVLLLICLSVVSTLYTYNKMVQYIFTSDGYQTPILLIAGIAEASQLVWSFAGFSSNKQHGQHRGWLIMIHVWSTLGLCSKYDFKTTCFGVPGACKYFASVADMKKKCQVKDTSYFGRRLVLQLLGLCLEEPLFWVTISTIRGKWHGVGKAFGWWSRRILRGGRIDCIPNISHWVFPREFLTWLWKTSGSYDYFLSDLLVLRTSTLTYYRHSCSLKAHSAPRPSHPKAEKHC